MITVSVKIPEATLTKVRKAIEVKLKAHVEEIALHAYNYIVTHEYPYYSGSYASSWNIRGGAPDKSYKKPEFKRGVYPEPDVKRDFNITNVYQTIYISNYVPHAAEVELVGTPTHTFPWRIAAEAKNATLMKYRMF